MPRYRRSLSRSPRRNDYETRLSRRDYRGRRRSRSTSRSSSYSSSRSRSESPDLKSKSLLISHLSSNLSRENIEEIFSDFGKVKELEISLHPVTKRVNNAAIITFETQAEAQNAKDYMHDAQMDGIHISCTFTNEKDPRVAYSNFIRSKNPIRKRRPSYRGYQRYSSRRGRSRSRSSRSSSRDSRSSSSSSGYRSRSRSRKRTKRSRYKRSRSPSSSRSYSRSSSRSSSYSDSYDRYSSSRSPSRSRSRRRYDPKDSYRRYSDRK